MELREGMYVRTEDGFIDKVINDYKGCCNNPNCNCKHVSCEHNYYDEENIIKSSDNLIDLVEVLDYVNGYRVDLIDEIDGRKYLDLHYMECEWRYTFNEDIKSIVTKEMFASVKYEVE